MINSRDTYSILMSVYEKEQPENLRAAIESMLSQTVPSDDFVLICDGPLNDKLDCVIEGFADHLHVHRLAQNGGLGNALNIGLSLCKNELVARMDSDDISLPDRCEKELKMFDEDPDLDIVSGQINEFVSSPDQITGSRHVPLTHEEILRFARKRNPFNHPCVMFKKSAVEAAGGYNEQFHLFEDYYLWIRMLKKGCKGSNHPDVLLNMRTPADMYLRRGGRQYASDMLSFHKWMKGEKFSTGADYLTGALPHALICRLPASIRRSVYKTIH